MTNKEIKDQISIIQLNRNDRTKRLRQCTKKFSNGFIVVAGFRYNGKIKNQKVSSKVEINSLHYQQNISEPIFEEKFADSYGKDFDDIEFNNVVLSQM